MAGWRFLPRGIFPRYSPSEDVDRELRTHLELKTEELVQAGWDPGEAWAEASRTFGDVEAVAGECTRIARSRENAVGRGERMGEFLQDVRYAARALVRAPTFTGVALVTLALGIGANSAIFSVVNGVVLRPLPYEDPDALVYVAERGSRGGTMAAAWANFVDWRTASRSFDALAAYGYGTTTVLGGHEPAWTTIAFVSEDFWQVFGVRPAEGRLLDPRDHLEGAASAVVVSRAFAREFLGGGDVVGRTVEAFGTRAEVVGVAPAGFDYPEGARLWAPVAPQGNSRTAHNWRVVGRLKKDVSLEVAAQELDALQARLTASAPADEPAEYLAVGTSTVRLQSRIVGDARRPLFILLAAAAFVLLVACTNLASTLLARGTTRTAELAVRSALGAGRARLIRQFLTESLVLAVGGAGAGLALSVLVLKVLKRVGAASVPRLEDVAVDGPVLAFTLGVAVLTALAFGLLPALRATGSQASSLRQGRGNADARGRTWTLLVATEVALALVLLVGSGLLLRSFRAVMAEDGGFDPSDVITASVALSGGKYPTDGDRILLWDELLGRLQAGPGISAVGLITAPPVSDYAPNGGISLDGDPGKSADALYIVASSGALDALDVPLLRGRLFQESDGPDAPHVVLVSRSFAERYWPGEDPIGKQVSGGGMDDYWDADPAVYGTVVGVVGDVRYRELTRAAEPAVYWHYRQRPYRLRFSAQVVAEASGGDAPPLAPVIRSTIQATDPDVAVPLRLMTDLVSESVAQRRFLLMVLGSFAAVALLLAGVGIYGVVSYGVARRTREMGIRLALGAAPSSVRTMVLAGALRPVGVGLVLGIGGSLMLSRLMGAFLYDVPATDPVTFTVVPLLLLGAALAASWFPARRGTRVDPVRAMRAD